MASPDNLFVRHGGVWKTSTPHVRVAGVWKAAESAWVKQAGVWKQVFGVGATAGPPIILTALTQYVDENTPISLLIETDVPCTISILPGDAGALFDLGSDTIGAVAADYEAMPPEAVGNTLIVPLRAARVDNPALFTDFDLTFVIQDLAEDGGGGGGYRLLLENGDGILREDGGLLSKEDTVPVSALALENFDRFLLEGSGFIIMEA